MRHGASRGRWVGLLGAFALGLVVLGSGTAADAATLTVEFGVPGNLSSPAFTIRYTAFDVSTIDVSGPATLLTKGGASSTALGFVGVPAAYKIVAGSYGYYAFFAVSADFPGWTSMYALPGTCFFGNPGGTCPITLAGTRVEQLAFELPPAPLPPPFSYLPVYNQVGTGSYVKNVTRCVGTACSPWPSFALAGNTMQGQEVSRTFVPEPSPVALLGMGAAFLALAGPVGGRLRIQKVLRTQPPVGR